MYFTTKPNFAFILFFLYYESSFKLRITIKHNS